MNFDIGTPVRAGTRVFAAISDQVAAAPPGGNGALGFGRKQPVAILQWSDGTITAAILDGTPRPAADLKRQFPLLAAAFEALCTPA